MEPAMLTHELHRCDEPKAKSPKSPSKISLSPCELHPGGNVAKMPSIKSQANAREMRGRISMVAAGRVSGPVGFRLGSIRTRPVELGDAFLLDSSDCQLGRLDYSYWR